MNKNTREKRKSQVAFLFLFTFLIFSVGTISAQPPFIEDPVFLDGFEITFDPFSPLAQNQDHRFHFHIINTSNGVPIHSGISCDFHLQDDSGVQVLMLTNSTTEEGNVDYEFVVGGGNFSKLGNYGYTIQCNSSTQGGIEVVEFQITPSGQGGTENMVFIIFIILMFYGINLFGFFGRNETMTLLGGMALMFLGVYLVNNGIIIYRDNLTNYFAYVTIAWGFVSTIMASIALSEDL